MCIFVSMQDLQQSLLWFFHFQFLLVTNNAATLMFAGNNETASFAVPSKIVVDELIASQHQYQMFQKTLHLSENVDVLL